ncbi:AraC family transcriptional regulator [Solitalea canadensis]|uniref:DNA-binding domain-containing protein, AraC-type n=1 Tax=Solitalea canadensis (strain ATCC 29591 / DSM 3403 / JCM 21819 / LMG 8368 / NBRC 15130 / NCIMB 12057 / USAM 9D) TaxID=929556 RepID=H8KXK8_SOLCM|nr:helix-turn-helix domain-containing protein [Solitalea canadensis]AFD05304.1 DNA-binding domain-containing protein, AraC-type [Solitalea canadensis DSM 3403]
MVKELLTYISYHLEEKISLDQLAIISGYSPFHLHKVLKLELQDSVGNYIKKQKMKKAAYLIGLTNTPIGEVKFLVGYDNDSSFARAFKDIYSISPSAFRENNELKRKIVHLNEDYVSLKCEAVKFKERQAFIFPSYGNYFSKSIYRVWKDVAQYLEIHKLDQDQFEYYAIFHNCQHLDMDTPLRYDAALVPKNDALLRINPFLKFTMPSERFAVYRFCSKVSDYQQNSLVITRHLIESSGFEHREGVAYFRFHQFPDWKDPDNLLLDWYLPIK